MIDANHLPFTPLTAFTAAAVLIVSIWGWRRSLLASSTSASAAADKLVAIAATHKRLASLPAPAPYITQLADSLPPGRVVLPQHAPEAFVAAIEASFASQNRHVLLEPSCIVQPQNVGELSEAVKHIAKEHTLRFSTSPSSQKGLFAVRCTGANPAEGIAGVKDGVLVDLSRLNSISLSADKTILTVGGGCTWESVYEFIDPLGLTVVGGRSTPVGVGGSTLGGGISFFSGRHGLICSNVAQYTVVLADGSIVTASEQKNSDLWRALKGGLNNFGVVAEFALRCYPGGPVWLNFTITPSFLSGSVMRAYYDHGVQAAREDMFDPNVSTPILSLAYVPDAGMSMWFTQLTYALGDSANTGAGACSPPPHKVGDKTWPAYWKRSPLGQLWGYRTCRGTFAHAQAVRQLGTMSPPGMRQSYAVTGFKLDLATMSAAVDVFHKHKAPLKALKRPGGNTAFCMVFQTLNPQWVNKGDPTVLGLDAQREDPVVVLQLCCNWVDAKHDALVRQVMQSVLQEIETVSQELGSEHRYRFANYAAEWQRPLDGYGEENVQFLKDVSKKYDPKGLFQTGCLGGFKLGREDL